jgi:hypothetical protein
MRRNFMKKINPFGEYLVLFSTLLLSSVWWLLTAVPVVAQAGNNAIYLGTTCCMPSPAFVDANVFTGTPVNDFCGKVYAAISGRPAGTVIDARGITPSLGCTNTPWWNGTTAIVTPTTILLPAGTITISTTWFVPNFTKISGAGSSTVIAAASGFHQPTGLNYNSNALIEMGYDYNVNSTEYSPYGGHTPAVCGQPNSDGASSDCQSVQIEHLTVDGTSYPTGNGIYNNASQELSYVNDITFTNIGGTALIVGDVDSTRNSLGPNGGNSGPYTTLLVNAGSNATAATACLQIGTSRGVHGITCNANGESPPATAIYLNGLNTSIEDVHVDGFVDGILIGSVSGFPAGDNVIFNVNGGNAHNVSGLKNVVHVSNVNATNVLMSDIAIMGVTSSASGVNTVEDDTSSPFTSISDASLAMYVLGESTVKGVSANWQSRLTTSLSVPSWGVGPNIPAGSCTSNGNLFSNTVGTLNHTLYACVNKVWTDIK